MAKGEVIVSERAEMYRMLSDAMEGKADISALVTSDEVQRALSLSILSAETEAEAFATGNLQRWSELIGKPVRLEDVHFNISSVENGPPVYGVCKLVDPETGEVSTRHVGGWRPVSQLLWLWSRGKIPYDCKLVEVGKAKPGQSAPLGIEPA